MSKRANGDGAVFFNNQKQKWVGQISLGYDEKGNRKRKTVYGSTKTEVKQKLKQIEIGIFTGNFTDKSNITIYQLAKQLLDDDYNSNFIKEKMTAKQSGLLFILIRLCALRKKTEVRGFDIIPLE